MTNKKPEIQQTPERKALLKSIRIFVESWNRVCPTDPDDPLMKPMTFQQALSRPINIEDFCQLPQALLDLKDEYIKLKNPDLREWTLKKFVECYKEFIFKELHNILKYEDRPINQYVQKKMDKTNLGTTEYYLKNKTFDDFEDIAIDEDEIYEDLPLIQDEDPTKPKYLRPISYAKYKK